MTQMRAFASGFLLVPKEVHIAYSEIIPRFGDLIPEYLTLKSLRLLTRRGKMDKANSMKKCKRRNIVPLRPYQSNTAL